MGKNYCKTLVSLLAAFAIAAPASGIAAASGKFDSVSVKVSYGDLDIHSKAGATVLYSRLRRASEEVCGFRSQEIKSPLTLTTKARACFHQTLEAAVEQIDSDTLQEIHAG